MRLGIKENELFGYFDFLEDESKKVQDTNARLANDPTHKLMCVSNTEQFKNLSFKEVKKGFFGMYENLSLYLDSSPTLDLAKNIDYKIRTSSDESSPFKRRRVL